jgi:LysR family nitrogen assimilation transcriptional regulator
VPAGASVDSADLAATALALTPGFRQLLLSRLDIDETPIRTSFEADSVHTVKSLVLRGDYCSALPFSFVRDELLSGALQAAHFTPSVRRHIAAVTRASTWPSAAIEVIIQVAQERLHELSASLDATVARSATGSPA